MTKNFFSDAVLHPATFSWAYSTALFPKH